ncbi:MAG: anthranilate synthase component I family protein [Marinifilaceae bacterium]
MRNIYRYKAEDNTAFIKKMLLWSKAFDRSCILHSNGYESLKSNYLYCDYGFIAGVGCREEIICNENAFESLKAFNKKTNDFLFGYLSYDLKNEIEDLTSENTDNLFFPALHFFIPEYVFIYKDDIIELHYHAQLDPSRIIEEIEAIEINFSKGESNLQSRISKNEYLEIISKIKSYIKRGDIYEVNFCQEFYDENAEIDPYSVYQALKEVSPVPFGAFYRLGDKYLMCASPERFLKKVGSTLISQPIKGTAKRGITKEEDEAIIKELQTNPKERAENIMITDLVRNDLSRSACKASVHVDELCGVYTYPQVHQMISTVSSVLRDDIDIVDAIKMAWPMGSMTGAPKVSAMKIIEDLETTKRSMYSGSIAYITPEKDFDFNVVIRSLLYDTNSKYLSCTFGGAITMQSKAESEYEECLLKAKAIKSIFA